MNIIEDIKKEIRQYELYKKIEESPLGGNFVKAAQYGGHIAGLRSALNRLQQTHSPDHKGRGGGLKR